MHGKIIELTGGFSSHGADYQRVTIYEMVERFRLVNGCNLCRSICSIKRFVIKLVEKVNMNE